MSDFAHRCTLVYIKVSRIISDCKFDMVRRRPRSTIMTPSRQRRRQRRAAKVSDAEILAVLHSRRLYVSGTMVMPFTAKPVVRRFVRSISTLTNTSQVAWTPNATALLDASEYSIGVVRYTTIRFIRARAYITNGSTSGIILVEDLTGFTVSSEIATGASIPAVGIQFSMATQQVAHSTSDTSTQVFFVSLDTAVSSNVVLDIFVEFC